MKKLFIFGSVVRFWIDTISITTALTVLMNKIILKILKVNKFMSIKKCCLVFKMIRTTSIM